MLNKEIEQIYFRNGKYCAVKSEARRKELEQQRAKKRMSAVLFSGLGEYVREVHKSNIY